MKTVQGWFVRTLLTIPLYLLTMVLLHEAGHAVAASHATSGIVRVFLWPGYELYPDFGYAPPDPWPEGRIPAFTLVTPVADVISADGNLTLQPRMLTKRDFAELRRHEPLIKLMGSMTTWMTSIVSLALVSLCKPKRIWLWMLTAGSLLHLDMLSYTVLPVFFGVRHLVWVGGMLPEPVEALSDLGVPEGMAITAIVSLSLLQIGWLYYLLRIKPGRSVVAL